MSNKWEYYNIYEQIRYDMNTQNHKKSVLKKKDKKNSKLQKICHLYHING